MILQTGMRTDIPAFYSAWFLNRIREGYVLVRNPYHYQSVTRYELSPELVDLIVFCTKNPAPMLAGMDELSAFRQYWFVTITPYGRDLEPGVPPVEQVIESTRKLSGQVGRDHVTWRYDPILITEKYSVQHHIEMFQKMASELSGVVDACVISFVDLIPKVQKNFPELRSVSDADMITLAKEFSAIGPEYGMEIRACGEGRKLEKYGVNCDGCMTVPIYEKAIGYRLHFPSKMPLRKECACFLGHDIGQYNTCPHGCRYCYANTDKVSGIPAGHDPNSPMLIGYPDSEDTIHPADQKSFIERQMDLSMFLSHGQKTF